MNDKIKALCAQAGFIGDSMYPVIGTNQETALQNLVELVAKEFIVDFYRRYLDLESEEDITEQVNRYVRDNFGVEQK